MIGLVMMIDTLPGERKLIISNMSRSSCSATQLVVKGSVSTSSAANGDENTSSKFKSSGLEITPSFSHGKSNTPNAKWVSESDIV